MNKRQYSIIAIIFFIIFFAFYSYYRRPQTLNAKTKKIAILKTASHPALDKAEQGFVEMIKKEYGDSVVYDIKNADGSIIAMNTIADSFAHDPSISLFYVIATAALQALAQKEAYRPIVFAAVTNPSLLNTSNRHNVCGITDAIDTQRQMDSVAQFVRNIQTIAIVYNIAELNSIHAVQEIKKEAKTLGILVYEIGILQTAEIANALEQYVQKIDAIVTPTDNLIASSASFIASFCNQYNIPLIVSDNLLLQYGALASFGIDYYQAGKHAGECAIRILNEEKTADQIGFEKLHQDTLLVNKTVYEVLKNKLVFDEATMKFAD